MADIVMMSNAVVHQQLHGYRGGHELLTSSVKLPTSDQDLVDRLSDLAGPIGPGELFDPYLTIYPLPSRRHYVFARTWQDRSAPRAGCVITRSLIVPMNIWESAVGILPSLFQVLEKGGRADIEVSDIIVQIDSSACFPNVHGGVTAELIEALFLESRQSIAILDAPNAEWITLRLIEAFWPSLRRSFAACTHAYSPRGIEGRPFDLLFAPKGAWSNYGQWNGRQIDGRATFKARHRWTEVLTHRIFESPIPERLIGPFGSLDLSSDNVDESTLRLYLMWTELEQRSESSPQAVLGLLDIASTRHDPRLIRGLLPTVDRSLELASNSFSPSELLAYLRTLLGKFAGFLPPTALLRKIRKKADEATAQLPSAALDILTNSLNDPLPIVMLAGIGDGLAASPCVHDTTASVLDLGRDPMQLLLSFSKKFARWFIQQIEASEDLNTFQALASVVDTRDQRRRSRLRRNMLPNLCSSRWDAALRVLLHESGPASITRAVKDLWNANQLKHDRFALALRDAADDPKKLGALREALLSLPALPQVDLALLSTATLNELDVDWLNTASVDNVRKRKLAITLVTRATEWQIRALPEHSIGKLICFLDGNIPETARIIAILLMQSKVVLEQHVHIIDSLIPYIDSLSSNRLVMMGLDGILAGRADCDPSEANSFFIKHASKVAPRDLVVMLVGSTFDSVLVSNNLKMLMGLPSAVKKEIASSVDTLSDELAKKRGLFLQNDAIECWAEFIDFSGATAEASQLRAASTALQYALPKKDLDVSSLIVSSFPIVYKRLKQGQSTPSLFSFFTFVDWDRCISAREDLVEAFIGSIWPPSHLIEIAVRVNELQKIIEILRRKKSGREYLAQILANQENLPETLRAQLIRLQQRKH
jgi:hypothetical protein